MAEPLDASPKYLETLLLYHEEEVMGEAYFHGLADHFNDPHEREMLHLMARVERVAAEIVRPLLAKYGLVPRPDATLTRIGETWIARHKDYDWRALMTDIVERYPDYLDQFDALEKSAPREDRAAIRTMADHEVAAIDFAKLEIVGERNSAAVLQQYIARAGAAAG